MIKQLTTILSALPGQILGLVTKTITAIESHVNLLATNPIRLSVIVIVAAVAVDVIFKGTFQIVSQLMSLATDVTKLLTWQVVATIWAVAVFSKK